MPAPQFNKAIHPHRWYSLTYQSNAIINEGMHHQVKRFIAEILIGNFAIEDIHSYIHGNIIFAINTQIPVQELDAIITGIRVPFVNNAPPLLFSLVLVAKNTDTGINYMYVYGSDVMDEHFRNSINDIFP